MDESKPLPDVVHLFAELIGPKQLQPPRRGLHSLTFQLNFSALHEIGGARRGCGARAKGVLGGI